MKINDYKTNGKTPLQNATEASLYAKELQPKLNAMVTFTDLEPQVENLKNISKDALMYGVPIVLKDNVTTKGILTTASSKILGNYVPVYNAHIADKLRDAGAIVIGKSSMDELGMGGTNLSAATGPVYNPYDLSRISGGSSGGSAVLVAAGAVPFAIGTDTGDSVRKPASYNGIVGVKPTYGRISRYGIIPYASSLDHVGYFTRNMYDAALALEVLAGRDDRDMTSSFLPVEKYTEYSHDVTGKKIAVLKNVTDIIPSMELKEQMNHLEEELRKKGAVVEEVSMREDLLRAALAVYFIIANCEATANHSNLDGIRFGVQEGKDSYEDIMTKSRTAGFSGLIRKRFVIGSYGLFEENQERLLRKAQKVRRLIVDEMNELYKTYDAIVAPASLKGAPKATDAEDKLSNEYLIAESYMCLGNFSGYPSMTVPFAMVDGLPVGLNMTCRAFEEQTMFTIGQAIEEISGWCDKTVEVK
ncbi:MAG: Asp-tRNA(Asn)/Glu-tRNA(Gln) amidotransferase subunit GatA [Erysipelotrichaceae bacterium]|nr:Asp-tRNA(Asn)/Glu-tRNA(Gln) amidotransferase subunit GatA [Erysipelotrichaceae bacterium]